MRLVALVVLGLVRHTATAQDVGQCEGESCDEDADAMEMEVTAVSGCSEHHDNLLATHMCSVTGLVDMRITGLNFPTAGAGKIEVWVLRDDSAGTTNGWEFDDTQAADVSAVSASEIHFTLPQKPPAHDPPVDTYAVCVRVLAADGAPLRNVCMHGAVTYNRPRQPAGQGTYNDAMAEADRAEQRQREEEEEEAERRRGLQEEEEERQREAADEAARAEAVRRHEMEAQVDPSLEPGVVFYSEAGYRGTEAFYPIGYYAMDADTPNPGSALFVLVGNEHPRVAVKMTVCYEQEMYDGDTAEVAEVCEGVYGPVSATGGHALGKVMKSITLEHVYPGQNSDPDVPVGVWLYSGINFSGQNTYLVGGVAPNYLTYTGKAVLEGVSGSIRVPAGAFVALCTDPDDTDGSTCVSIHNNVEDLSTLGPGLLNSIRMAKVSARPLEDAGGMAMYTDPDQQGESQWYGDGCISTLGSLANTLTSVWVSKGATASLYPTPGCEGKHWDLTTGTINDFSDPQFPEGINDNIMAISIVSTATCTPECANGLCVRNDVCECHAGWIGAACNRRRPNPSSNVYCERNTLLVGERTKCTLVPRYDLGAPVDACPSDFTVTAGASSEVGGPLFESTHEQEADCDNPASSFEFWVSSEYEYNQEDFAPLFSVQLAAQGTELQVPQFLVKPLADSTSEMACDKAHVMKGEATTCTIRSRQQGRAIITYRRTLSSWSDGSGSVSHLAADGNAEVASEFRFRFVLRRANGTKSTVGVRVCGGGAGSVCTPVLVTTDLHHVKPAKGGKLDPFTSAMENIWAARYTDAVASLDKAITGDGTGKHAERAGQARFLRCKIQLLRGDFAAVRKDLRRLGKVKIGTTSALKKALKKAQKSQDRGMVAHAMEQNAQAVNHFSAALQIAKGSDMLHLLRAQSALALGNYGIVKYDTTDMLIRNGTNAEAMKLLAQAQFDILGNTAAAIKNLRLCMRIDLRDVAKCIALHDRVALVFHQEKAYAKASEAEDWEGAVSSMQRVLAADKLPAHFVDKAHKELCQVLPKVPSLDNAALALASCDHALRKVDDANDPIEQLAHVLHGSRAWALSALDRFQDAIAAVNAAMKMCDEDSGRDYRVHLAQLKQMIEEAIRMQKESEDYYTILGVERGATLQELKAAYRKLARIWHPDRNKAPNAERMFMSIVEAYQILINEDLRERYDNGEDVSKMARKKGEEAWKAEFTFRADDVRADGKVNASYTDPETGNEETVEIQVKPSEDPDDVYDARPVLKKHCCLAYTGMPPPEPPAARKA